LSLIIRQVLDDLHGTTQVAIMLAQGYCTAEIAKALGMTRYYTRCHTGRAGRGKGKDKFQAQSDYPPVQQGCHELLRTPLSYKAGEEIGQVANLKILQMTDASGEFFVYNGHGSHDADWILCR
jgi:hypothetical protein